jgi:membrane peptidoglycan carboxypeptidase
VAFDTIPGEMIDATTAIEDKDFWDNAGFDPVGIVSAGLDTIAGKPRGASTITQQLVRARLLPASAFEGTTYERKLREIIQSIRLTEEYPGKEGKETIITAYLNQNFYGNSSYGVQSAAKGYFNKAMKDLTLAQFAILAAIPQSPSKFDLMNNVQEVCLEGSADDCQKVQLVVPDTSEVVVRRDYILDLMKTRSPLTGEKYTAADYDRAKTEPVILTPPPTTNWKAAHFVWQVREALSRIVCPDTPTNCPRVDTGGYRVTTTLDWKMQQKVEKWVFAAARAPNSKSSRTILRSRKIPASEWGWILALKGHRIQNAAAGVIDYRTGEVLAYAGSAGYTAKGNKKFDPQWDVLSDAYRQPGSAIKPINYLVGIDDGTLTASTMFMDVFTNFGNNFTPIQADKLERGPVRLRSALQFSLNVPAIKGTLITGLDHVFERTKEFGLEYEPTRVPVTSMGIGTLEVHPISLLGAYGMVANGGRLMPRTIITKVLDDTLQPIYPLTDKKPAGKQVVSKQAAYIVTDILAGNTDTKVNPFWGEHAIYDGGRRRPAAYKTGTTSDNKDVAAYGYLAPPKDPKAPALAVGIWMGNSDSTPNDGKLSLDTSAPLWDAILTDISRGTPIAQFKPPSGLQTATVDAFTGLKPGPFTTKTVKELFIKGTVPTQRETSRVAKEIDSASGLLWQDGCVGPKVSEGFFNMAEVEAGHQTWQKADRNWGARAARGIGVRGSGGTKTAYFYGSGFYPFGRSWGARFAPSELCPLAPETPPPACDPLLLPPEATPCPSVEPEPSNGKPPKSPKP